MALRADGGNPWNGTSNDDGADTLGSPLWTDGGSSTVYVFPRSNATGGSHVTNKNNCCPWFNSISSNSFSRAHFMASEDGILIVCDANSSAEDGVYSYHFYLGRYTPRTGLESILTLPYAMIANSGADNGFPSLGTSNVYGGTGGNSSRNGGILALPVNDVMDMTMTVPSAGQQNVFYQPNNLISPNEFESTPVSFFAHEGSKIGGPDGTGNYGLAGYPDTDLFSSVYNISGNTTNSDATKGYVGHNTIAERKHCLNWDGGASPGLSQNRRGRQSFTP